MWFINWLKSLGPVEIVIIIVLVVVLWKAVSIALRPLGYRDRRISRNAVLRMYDNSAVHLITTDASGNISERELGEGEYEEQS